MAANQVVYFRLIIKFLVALKCKPYKCVIYMEKHALVKKIIFTNWLNMGLQLQA